PPAHPQLSPLSLHDALPIFYLWHGVWKGLVPAKGIGAHAGWIPWPARRQSVRDHFARVHGGDDCWRFLWAPRPGPFDTRIGIGRRPGAGLLRSGSSFGFAEEAAPVEPHGGSARHYGYAEHRV